MKGGAAPKSPNRRRVLDAIQENPGICLQELADRLSLTRTALSHHLRGLQSSGLVASTRQGRRMLLFPNHINRPAERSVLGLLRLASARSVLEALYRNPTVPFRQLAQQLDLAPHSVRWHVARLQQQGLIHVLSSGLTGRGHVIHFHPSVRESLGPMAATPLPPAVLVVPPDNARALEEPALLASQRPSGLVTHRQFA